MFAPVFILQTFLNIVCTSIAVKESWFAKDSICNVEKRITLGCSEEVSSSRNFLDCLAVCGRRDGLCFGASYDETERKCVIHGTCAVNLDCVPGDVAADVWSRPPAPSTVPPTTTPLVTTTYCLHGVWNVITSSCDCYDGRHGDRCELYPSNCDYLEGSGSGSGNYKVFIDPKQDGTTVMEIVCNFQISFSRLLVMGNSGKLNNVFNKTWADYENGFYDSAASEDSQVKNFWVGLKNWHTLNTVSSCGTLMVNMYLNSGWSSVISREYFGFQISGGPSYKMSYSSNKLTKYGTLPDSSYSPIDCLNAIQHTSFSTYDNDNDDDVSSNCALVRGSGWWWHYGSGGCTNAPCNLMGSWENWGSLDSVPGSQRFSMQGIDMNTAHAYITEVKIFAICS